jgi:ATP-dependent Lon protease
MTGEVNLRGNVTEIGGLKEKLLAALRGGIKKRLSHRTMKKTCRRFPQTSKKAIEIVPVRTIDEVLAHALIEMPRSKAAESKEKIGTIPSDAADSKGDDVIRH